MKLIEIPYDGTCDRQGCNKKPTEYRVLAGGPVHLCKKHADEVDAITLIAHAAVEPTGTTLLDAVKMAYRKHHLDDPSIGWEELSDVLLDALCNEMGDEGYQVWLMEAMKEIAKGITK